MCVLVALVTCRTDDTVVVFSNSSHWPVVSVIQTGCGVGDSTMGSSSCLRSFLVVIPDKLMGEVESEGQKVLLGLAVNLVWHPVIPDNISIVDARLHQLGSYLPVPLLVLPRVLVEPVHPVHEFGIGCHRWRTLELHDRPILLSALSGDPRSVGCPVRCVGTGEVVHHSLVFPCCGHHPLTLSPLGGTTGQLSDLSFGFDQVRWIPDTIGSRCLAQVSTLTCQILEEHRRGIEIVSEDNMAETVNWLCQSNHDASRQPHQFVDLFPVLAGVNLQVVAICCHHTPTT